MQLNLIQNRDIMNSVKEQAEIQKNREIRIKQVRLQSNEIAKKLRDRVRSAKEQQIRRLENIKEKELLAWKTKKIGDLEHEYDNCLKNIGEAHRAAQEEEIEQGILKQKREEFDLLAAERGKLATHKMLEAKRKEEEERVMRRKRLRQKTVGIQADLYEKPTHEKTRIENFEDDSDYENLTQCEEEHNYNPKNFAPTTSNESTNSPTVQTDSEESLIQFNRITNLLKKRQKVLQNKDELEESDIPIQEVIDISDDSDSENIAPQQTKTAKQLPRKPVQRVIVKSPVKKPMSRKQEPIPSSSRYSTKTRGTKMDDLVEFHKKRSDYQHQMNEIRLETETDLRRDISKRPKEPLQKEKIRRDYEKLREELDQLAKEEQQARIDAKKYSAYSTTKSERAAEEKKQKMNAAFENVVRQRTVITCPPVKSKQSEESKRTRRKTSEVNVADDTGASSNEHVDSDSCGSIILIVDEPEKNPKKTSKVPSTTKPTPPQKLDVGKVEKLENLLERINYQKKLLLRELEKHHDTPGPDLERVLDCIKKLENEKKILTDSSSENVRTAGTADNQNTNKKTLSEIEVREKKLREREQRLEEKIRELYRKEKAKKLEIVEVSDSTNSTVDYSVDGGSVPVEIVIKVNPKSPKSKKTKKLRVTRCIDTLSREPGKVYPKTPVRKAQKSRQRHVERSEEEVEVTQIQEPPKNVQKVADKSTSITGMPAESGSSETSSILQLPKNLQEKLEAQEKHMEERSTMTDNRSVDVFLRRDSAFTDSTSYRSLPEARKPDDFPLMPLDQEREERSIKLNPHLLHYIGRLLRLPKNIGERLGVSVSSVSTPGSSTINTTANVSGASDPSFDTERLDRLKNFIEENYSFLNEINESLEQSKKGTERDNVEEELKRVDGIWKDVLNKSSKNQVPSKSSQKSEKQPAGILKSTKSTKSGKSGKSQEEAKKVKKNVPTDPQQKKKKETAKSKSSESSAPENVADADSQGVTNNDVLSMAKYLESHMLNNYVEYTSNCHKRIAELTEMMEKVRQEKLKMLERNTPTSQKDDNSQKSKEQTENSQKRVSNQEVATSSGSELKSPSHHDPPSEEINNILTTKSRQIGVSKDSGISMSRPVTSSDYRDSPENTFQPISREIPKLPKQKTTDEEKSELGKIILHNLSKIVQHSRKIKPPMSLIRYSPQLEEKTKDAHELSTIAEVETPGTSKVNIPDVEIPKENVEYQQFEDYDKYMKEKDQSELPDVQKQIEKVQDATIPQYQEFVDPKTYGLEEISTIHQEQASRESSRNSSIQDLVAELKRRKIIMDSGTESSDTSSSPLKKILEHENITPATEANKNAEPVSPRKQQTLPRIITKTPDRNLPEMEAEKTKKTPTKKKLSPGKDTMHHSIPSNQSNDTLSGIEVIKEGDSNLEGDLQKIGLNWAASTLKRTHESQTVKSTSSSSTNVSKEFPVFRRTVEIEVGESSDSLTSSASPDQPLNLRDFLKRELTIRSEKNLTNNSSFASPFMSNASSSNSKSSTDKNMLRTSTPVEEPKSSKSSRIDQMMEPTMFSGASLSTVNSESSKSRNSTS